MNNVQAIKSILSLDGIIVDKIVFDRKDTYVENDEDLNFEFTTDIAEAENADKYKVTVGINIDNGERKELLITIRLTGYFSFETDKEIDDDRRFSFIQTNAIAVLFPYLRSLISTITANAFIKPIIIPPININTLIARQNEMNNNVEE